MKTTKEVIVRGVRHERLAEILDSKVVCFKGPRQGIPNISTDYIALYVGDPVSKVQYIGTVEKVE